MNERIIKLGLDSGMLNYVDHETPRHYFLCGNADEECLIKFAESIVMECADWIDNHVGTVDADARSDLLNHFGIEQ
jgi:hypothetical protein